eukprot:5661794-Amphidinium_carterae.1
MGSGHLQQAELRAEAAERHASVGEKAKEAKEAKKPKERLRHRVRAKARPLGHYRAQESQEGDVPKVCLDYLSPGTFKNKRPVTGQSLYDTRSARQLESHGSTRLRA